MIRQCSLLLKIQLLELFGINEALHSKDKKKRVTLLLMGFCYLIVGFMLALYIALTALAMGMMGAQSQIPSYLLTISSLVILIFTFMKAGSILFTMRNHEILFSLPIRSFVIITSRFLGMYVGNFLMTALVMVPGAAVYAVMIHPGVGFYVMTAISLIFIPLIPMSIAAALGAAILAMGAGMKHKNLVTVFLTIVIGIAAIILSFSSSRIDLSALSDFSSAIAAQVNRVYPPAALYGRAVGGSDWISFLLFLALSAVSFAAFTMLVTWKYTEICGALRSHTSGKRYVLKPLRVQSPLKALYQKELKRYFASSVYVSNTIFGYLLMILLSGAVFAVGGDKAEALMQMPGGLRNVYPYALAFCCAVCPITVASISIEGKQWWIAQSLPVRVKALFDSKILLNLTFALPCTVLSVFLIGVSVSYDGLGLFWLAVIPVIYNLFFTVLGVFVNARFPRFDWENEARIIKQGASAMFVTFAGMGATFAPLICMMFLKGMAVHLINGTLCAVLAVLTALMYRANNRMDIREIG